MGVLLETIDTRLSAVDGAIARCFRDRKCTQCGACCIYITDQTVPNGRTTRELMASWREKVATAIIWFPKTKSLDCLHLSFRSDGTKSCGVHDLKTHPSVLGTDVLKKCRHWCWSSTELGITKTFGKIQESSKSSEQDELVEWIAENILLPPSLERFNILVSDFERGLFNGVEDRIIEKIKLIANRLERGRWLSNASWEYILADWIMERYFMLGIVPNLELFSAFWINTILYNRYKKNRLSFWAYYGAYSLTGKYKQFFDQFGSEGTTKPWEILKSA